MYQPNIMKAILILSLFCLEASVIDRKKSLLKGVHVRQDLHEHTQEFNKPQIIQVAENLYVGVGYGIANSIFVKGPEGLIVIDTMDTVNGARAVFKDFRKIVPSEPVKAIIYTHFHGDHKDGTWGFVEDSHHLPDVWAHEKFSEQLETMSLVGPVLFYRGMRQFGNHLPQEPPYFLNAGIGKGAAEFFLESDKEVVTSGTVWPNKIVKGFEENVEIAGLNVTLLNLPGETPDHLGVWLPSLKAFMCGDNLYKTFPNIYAIRGTIDRDPVLWKQSLDKIRDLEPEYLILSHTQPVIGKENVKEILTVYRDGIQLVHDQTLRFLNKGFHRDDIARMIQMPQTLLNHRYLRQHYGTVEWSSKAIFNKYMGWFTGFPEDLSPFTAKEESKRVVRLAGGPDNCLNRAKTALNENSYQWALELSTYVLNVDTGNTEAVSIRREALKGLAGLQSSANGRNLYLTTILEDEGMVKMEMPTSSKFSTLLPIDKLFRFMSFWVKPEICGSTNIKLLVNFTDLPEMYSAHLRNGIVATNTLVRTGGDFMQQEDKHSKIYSWDCYITVSTQTWRDVVGTDKPLKDLLNKDFQDAPWYCDYKILEQFFSCLELK